MTGRHGTRLRRLSKAFPALRPGLIFWDSGRGTCVQSLDGSIAYVVNDTAREVLKYSNGRISAQDIMARLTAGHPGAPPEVVMEDLCSFFDDAERKKILTFKASAKGVKSPRASAPSIAYLSLTDKCNLRCGFCYGKRGRHHSDIAESDWLEILSKLPDLMPKRPLAVFTGGEPTLYPFFRSIACAAKDNGFRLGMYSNGTLFDDDAVRLCASLNFDVVSISIHGAKAGTADAITGVPGSFDRSTAALRRLSLEGVPVAWQATISRLNLSEVDDMARLAYKLGASAFAAGSIDFHDEAGGECLCPEEEAALWEIMGRINAEMSGLMRVGMDNGHTSLVCGHPGPAGSPPGACGIGSHICHIRNDGHLTPCPVLSDGVWDLGSLLGQDPRALWSEASVLEPLRGISLEDMGECGSCGIRARCRGGCRARVYYSLKNLLGCDHKIGTATFAELSKAGAYGKYP